MNYKLPAYGLLLAGLHDGLRTSSFPCTDELLSGTREGANHIVTEAGG